MFPASYEEILERVSKIDPVAYGKDRNYIDGHVTYLSPYISRGVISTKFVYQQLIERGFKRHEMEKMVQELVWRDYWQQVWRAKGNAINQDLKQEQSDVRHFEMPLNLIRASTGIAAVDDQIERLKNQGYMHNHFRMYFASLACNIAKSHWRVPAQWMYYYLLDGDWASNALSWQWVAGTNSSKKYLANQENINKFSRSNQDHTFLDVTYEVLPHLSLPHELKETEIPKLETILPDSDVFELNPELPTFLYTSYNLDPTWGTDQKANRVLLFEPDHFKAYPVHQNVLDFVLKLSWNIPEIQIFTGSFDQFVKRHNPKEIRFKEHPFSNHFRGEESSRDWLSTVTGYYPSFFSFWKKCKKEL